MKRKLFLGACTIVMMISIEGCSGKTYDKQADADSQEVTQATTEEVLETSESENQEKTEYVYIPDQFPVYEDGESHRLLYAADQDYYHYSNFTNKALEEYGYASISLPDSLAMKGTEMRKLNHEDELSSTVISALDRSAVIDTSVCFSQTRKIYSLRTPGMYLFHAWVQPYEGNIHTMSLKDFANTLNIGGSLTSDFVDMEKLGDGSTRYTCLYKDDREYTGDGVPYYGKAVIRLKDGKAWCAIFAEKDHEDGPRMAEYILKQSVRYEEG